ncbi:MAG: hypothetical protein R3181_05175 [Rubricoccaceae bacterium]|nr:hypothetical protein [Rubricoccaceae bacterium]
MKLHPLAVLGGLLGIAVLGTVVVQQQSADHAAATLDADRAAFEAMLAAHPYSTRPRMTREQLRAIPKRDRPDLAIEQDFLRTLDPATGEVPVERKYAANLEARRLQAAAEARGGGPLVTEAWEERGPDNVAGRTRAILFDPNDPSGTKVWAGGVAGGLWYTDDITDEDATWTSVNDFWSNLAIGAIAAHPTDTQVMYVGTGEGFPNIDAVRGAGIFKSADGGATWARLPSTETSAFYNTQGLAVHPTTGDVYAATSAGLYRSQDGGGSWELVLGGAGRDLEIAADGVIYVSLITFTGQVHASATGDFGSWQLLNNGTNGFPNNGLARIELATTAADPAVLYAVAEAGGGVQGIYRTADRGTTWTAVPRPNDVEYGPEFSRGQAWYDLTIAADPTDPDVVFVGGINLFKTVNGGTTWSQVSHWYGGFFHQYVHADQHHIVFKPGSSTEVLFSNDGGVYYTADATAPVPVIAARNNGYNVTQFYAGAISPDPGNDFMLAGSQDNGTQRYLTPGVGSTIEVRGGDGGFTFIDQTQAEVAISSYVFNTFNASSNFGFSFPTVLINDQGSGSFINPADYDDREDILYTYKTAFDFYRVSGVSGVPQTSVVPAAFNTGLTHFRVSPYAAPGTSTLFTGSSAGRIFKLENAHATPTLTQLPSPPALGAVSCIEIGEDEDHLLVTYSNYGVTSVWETVDAGTTWANKEGNLPDIPVRWALFNPLDRSQVILATEAGIWETEDFDAAEPTWTVAPGFPITRVDMLQVREADGMVMAATHGRGSFTAPFRGFGVATEPGLDGALPGTHALSAPAPNPFRGRTAFTLTLAEAQPVRVALHDVQGRRLAVLHDGALAAGTAHAFEVDGRGLPAGTYVVSVAGERFRDALRLTLVE